MSGYIFAASLGLLLSGIIFEALKAFRSPAEKRTAARANTQADPTDGYSDDELETAALAILRQLPHCSFLSTDMSDWERNNQLYQQKRAEFANYPSRRMRRHIMQWIDYYEKRNNEGLTRMKENLRKNELVAKLRALSNPPGAPT